MINFTKTISFRELSVLYPTVSIISGCILVFNIVLLYHPLTKVLGYEFSALNSLCLTILSGIFSIKWFKYHSHITKTFLLTILAFAFIPLLINIINSIITEFCSIKDGILFYLMITFPSVLIGSTIGTLVVYLIKRLRIMIFLMVIVVIALIPVIEIYFYPQIYFYNLLIAFFPGTIYDEGMAVDTKLAAYRILNIIFSFIIIYLITFDKKQIYKIFNLIFILIISSAFFFISPSLGFSTTYSKLNGLLTGKLETSNYLIHYDERFSESEAKLLALHTEYYFSVLEKTVEAKPSKKMEIFLFRDNEQKQLYFGSGNADVAKPWLYQVYLSMESWRGTLKHEMAHIFSAEFGSTTFKLAGDFNPFLIEGFATSQDPFRDNLYIDYLASLSNWKSEEKVLSNIFTHTGFFNVNSVTSYVLAGSFSKFLISKYGINKFKLYYATNDIKGSYNITDELIITDYENYLSEFPVDTNIHTYYYYFGRQSIVQKVCPRYIGRQIQKGWEHVQKGEIEKAKLNFYDVLLKVPNYSALSGFTECLEKQDSLETAVNIYSRYVSSFKNTPYDYLLRLKLADSYAKLSRFEKAKNLYNELLLERPTINIELISLMRLKLLESDQLQKYLTGNDSVKFSILDQLNRLDYFYPSLPVFINLAVSTNQDYRSFIRKFDKKLFINDIPSAWSVYKLSDYMIENFDFRNARKMAALARRYKEWKHLNILWNDNFDKAEWFYYNADAFLNQFRNNIE